MPLSRWFSAIDATTIKVTGTDFTVANVAFLASQLTLKNTITPSTTYAVSAPVFVSATEAKMTVATIANTVTSVTWTYTPATGAPVTGTFAAELSKPVIDSVVAYDSTNIDVTFSELVTGATTAANYDIYSQAGPSKITFENDGAGGTASAAGFLEVDINDITPAGSNKTKVRVTINDVHANTTGYIGDGLSKTPYILYANTATPAAGSIADVAGNYLNRNTVSEFTGVLTTSTVGPVIRAASFDNGTKQLTVGFDLATTTLDRTKISIVNGTATQALTASNVITNDGTLTVSYTLTDAQITAIGTLTSDAKVVLGAGAVRDASSNNNAVQEKTLTTVVRPTLTAAVYDDKTNRLTLTWDQTMNIVNFNTALAANKVRIETSTGVYTNVNGAVLPMGNSTNVVIQADQATARAIAQSALTTPKIRITSDGNQNTEAITDIQNIATAPVVAIEADYTGKLTLTKTAPSLVSARYLEQTDKLELTFSKPVNATASDVDSTKITVYVNGTSIGVVGTDAATPLKDNPDEATDGTKLTFDIVGTTNNLAPANTTEIETAEVKNGIQTVAVSLATAGVKDEVGTFVTLDPANKINATYVADTSVALAIGSAATESSRYATVQFNREVNQTPAQVPTNYIAYLKTDPTITVAFDEANLLSDERTVYLHSSAAMNLANGSYYIGVQNITPKNGTGTLNVTATNAIALASANNGASVAAPQINAVGTTNNDAVNAVVTEDSTVGLSAGDKITLTYNKPVQVSGTVAGASGTVFTLGGGGTTLGAGNINVTRGAYANQLVATFGTGVDIAAAVTTIGTTNGQTAIKALDGTSAAPGGTEDTVTIQPPTGYSAPYITAAALTDTNATGIVDAGDKLVLTFDQTINPAWNVGTTMTAAGLTIGNTGNAIIDGVDAAGTAFDGTYSIGSVTAALVAKSATNQLTITLPADANLNRTGATAWIQTAAKIGSTNTASDKIVNVWNQFARGGASAAAAIAKAVTPTVTGDDGTAPTISSVALYDANNSGTVSTGDVLVIDFNKSIYIGTPALTDLSGLGIPTSIVGAGVQKLGANKLVIPVDNGTGLGLGKLIDIATFGSSNIKSISGVNAAANGGKATSIVAVEAGTSATAKNNVNVTAGVAGAGAIVATEDALLIGSKIVAYTNDAGTLLNAGPLANAVITDTDVNSKSDVVNITTATFDAATGKTTLMYVTKDGTTHVVNFATDMTP